MHLALTSQVETVRKHDCPKFEGRDDPQSPRIDASVLTNGRRSYGRSLVAKPIVAMVVINVKVIVVVMVVVAAAVVVVGLVLVVVLVVSLVVVVVTTSYS